MTTTRMYLIRHGATSSNEQRPYVLQGSGIDHPLSENGRRQTVALGEFMSPFDIDAIFASPLKRAVETAEYLANRRSLAIETFADLKEVDVGDWEGQAWASIEQQQPVEYAAMMRDPWNNPYVGGECYADVLRRTQPILMQLMRDHPGKTIGVVAHQVVNRAFIADVMDVHRPMARGIKQSNTGINIFKYNHDSDEINVQSVNVDFHLHQLQNLS